MSNRERLARRMFSAYNKQAGGKTWDGKPIPPWHLTGDRVQANWFASADEALSFASSLILWGPGGLPENG